jgi:hypothetical protein
MGDAKTSQISPTLPSNHVRRPSKRSPLSSSFKRRSPPAGSPLKTTITQNVEITNLDMAASFLQYCAMCEKQILTPSNAILYCSEACRRKDSCKPLSLAAVAMNNTPPSSAPSSPHSLLPIRTPTGATSTTIASIGIPAGRHSANSDVDPTEWKPRLLCRSNSEAFRYLAQFHSPTSAVASDAGGEGGGDGHRHLFSHRSTTSIASMTTPSLSLSQTPSTASSSLSTGAEHDFNTRPLQSRHNPMYSASAGTTKSVDLVMPFVAPSTAASLPCQFDDSKYEKMPLAKTSTWPAEGLGFLIGREGEK